MRGKDMLNFEYDLLIKELLDNIIKRKNDNWYQHNKNLDIYKLTDDRCFLGMATSIDDETIFLERLEDIIYKHIRGSHKI